MVANNKDKLAKGRQSRGEKHSAPRKLTAEHVREIRRRYAAGETTTALGVEFGVASVSIWGIVRRKYWAWLDPQDTAAETTARKWTARSLTSGQVAEVHALYAGDGRVRKTGQGRSGRAVGGCTILELASRFGVGRSTIHRIIHEATQQP